MRKSNKNFTTVQILESSWCTSSVDWTRLASPTADTSRRPRWTQIRPAFGILLRERLFQVHLQERWKQPPRRNECNLIRGSVCTPIHNVLIRGSVCTPIHNVLIRGSVCTPIHNVLIRGSVCTPIHNVSHLLDRSTVTICSCCGMSNVRTSAFVLEQRFLQGVLGKDDHDLLSNPSWLPSDGSHFMLFCGLYNSLTNTSQFQRISY